MYQPPFTTGGASQLPPHFAQRNMQPVMPTHSMPGGQYDPAMSVPYPTYQPQQAGPNIYQTMQGGGAPPQPAVYPSPMYQRPPMNPAAEPQMEGASANYPHLPGNPTYYPGAMVPGVGGGVPIAGPPPNLHQAMPPGSYHPQQQQPHHYAVGRSAGMGHQPPPIMGVGGGHQRGGGMPVKMPFFDPEAEVEAGRGPEPGAPGAAGGTGSAGGAGGGAAGGTGGQPAGLNQAQVGPMEMHPDGVVIFATVSPADREVVLGTTVKFSASPVTEEPVVTSATLRPMSPNILIPTQQRSDAVDSSKSCLGASKLRGKDEREWW